MHRSKWVAYSIISSARCDVTLRNHLPGIGIISITSTVAFGMVKCGLSAKRAAAASCDLPVQLSNHQHRS